MFSIDSIGSRTWPSLYSTGTGAWMYYYFDSDPRTFHNFETGQNVEIPQ